MRTRMSVCVSWAAALAGIAFFSAGASATVLSWDFTVDPTAEPVPMTAYARGVIWDGGTGAGTPYGGAIAGTGLQGDGTAIFADSPAESSNSGFVIGGFTGGITMDMRVKVLEDVTNNAGKSVSFKDSTNRGRGLALNGGNLQLKDGSGTVRTYGPVDMTSDYQIIRNSLSGLDTGGGVFVVSTYLWNGGGWTHLGDQGLGGSGAAGEIVAAGIGIGSLAGSSTQSGKFQVDWVRLDNANALGGTGGFLLPEPATLALLVLGLLPVMRRRR